MKIRSAILTQMSGKLGGAVGSSVRGGQAVMRSLVIPKNPESANQAFIRAALSGLSSNWKALTDAQRAGWAALASDQESGIDVYVAANVQVLRAGIARVDNAPSQRGLAWLIIPDPATFSASTDDTDHFDMASSVNTDTWLANTRKINLYISTTPQIPSRLAEEGNTSFLRTITPAGAHLAETVTYLNSPTFKRLSGLYTSGAGGDRSIYVVLVGTTTTGAVTAPVKFRLQVATL